MRTLATIAGSAYFLVIPNWEYSQDHRKSLLNDHICKLIQNADCGLFGYNIDKSFDDLSQF